MELNSNNFHEFFFQKDFLNQEIKKIREKLKTYNQNIHQLSVYERKILIIENIISFYLMQINKDEEDYYSKEQNDIIKIALDFFDKFEYFVSPTPEANFNNKKYLVSAIFINKLEDFTGRITEEAFQQGKTPCIYNIYFHSTIPYTTNSQFGNKIIQIRYVNVDYDYKSGLISKRFSQNEQ